MTAKQVKFPRFRGHRNICVSRGRLLPGVGAGADELNNIIDAVRHDAVRRRRLLMSKHCRADSLVPTPADRGEGEYGAS